MNKSAYIVRTVDRWTDRTMPAGLVEDNDDAASFGRETWE